MLEYLGYLASAIVLISVLMSSAKKLRWINLAGSAIFALYGFLINALPVGVMNTGVAIINIYYLYRMYHSKDYFKILPIDQGSVYLKNFLRFYESDINKYFSTADIDVDHSEISFYILRNVVPAGFFVANRFQDHTLRIDFDYVVPTYRDFKMGEYIFKDKKEIFLEKGFTSLVTFTNNEKHEKYLNKMGFHRYTVEDTEDKRCYKIDLEKA